MDATSYDQNTRVFWDGGEVHFVRWTRKALVFSWAGTAETAVHMPRGAVLRLKEKGVLRIEGYQPWNAAMEADEPPDQPPVDERAQKASLIKRLIRRLNS